MRFAKLYDNHVTVCILRLAFHRLVAQPLDEKGEILIGVLVIHTARR